MSVDRFERHQRLGFALRLYSGVDKIYTVSQKKTCNEWYEAGLCDREVAGSTPARGCCVPTPTQRAIPPGSVNE